MHTNDLHATLLALMGLNHERLTYRYAGCDYRLTDVAGKVCTAIFQLSAARFTRRRQMRHDCQLGRDSDRRGIHPVPRNIAGEGWNF